MTKKSLFIIFVSLFLLAFLGFINQVNDNGVEINPNLKTDKRYQQNHLTSNSIDTVIANVEKSELSKQISLKSIDEYYLALTQAMELVDATERTSSVSLLLTTLSNQHTISDAFNWLLLQEQSTEIGEYYFRLLKDYITVNPSHAGDIILSLSNFDAKQSIVNEYVHQLALKDPLIALAWSNNLQEESLKHSAQQQTFKAWLIASPKESLDYLSTFNELNEYLKSDIISQAANNISRKDYADTAQNLYQYPEQYRGKIAYSVISYWPDDKLDQAMLWITTLDNGTAKNLAIKSYVDKTGIQQGAATTFDLIETVNNQELRFNLTQRAFNTWYQQTPSEATQHLQQLPYLSAQEKNQLHNNNQQPVASPRYK